MKVYLSLLISRFYSVLKANKTGVRIYQILFLLCVTSIFFLSSCKKEKKMDEDKYELTGTVVDIFTKQPIPSATVSIIEYNGNYYLDNVTKKVGTTKSDAKGKFKISFDYGPSNFRYELQAHKDGYFEVLESRDSIRILINDNKKKSKLDISLSPITNLMFHIKGNKGGAIMSTKGNSGDKYLAGADTTKNYYGVPSKKNTLKFEYWIYDEKGAKTGDYGNFLYKRRVNVSPTAPPDTAHYLIEF